EAYLWDPFESRLLATLPHAARVTAIAMAHDGGTVATGGDDQTAQLWNAATGKPAAPPLKHPAPVRAIAFAPDGRPLATASADRRVRFWRVADGQAAAKTFPLGGDPYFVAYSPTAAAC